MISYSKQQIKKNYYFYQLSKNSKIKMINQANKKIDIVCCVHSKSCVLFLKNLKDQRRFLCSTCIEAEPSLTENVETVDISSFRFASELAKELLSES